MRSWTKYEATDYMDRKSGGEGGAGGFPVRVAALDIGSNAIRYLATEFPGPGDGIELESHRFSVRLGSDAFTLGYLSETTLVAAIDAVRHFALRLRDLRISRHRAVATSAVRESLNRDEIIERIRSETGIDLETISAVEEARLGWVAVERRFRLPEGRWLLADLGGGSLELSLMGGGGIEAVRSLPLGSVRMLREVPSGDPCDSLPLLRRAAAPISPPGDYSGRLAGVLIAGGSADAVGDLIGRSRGDPVTIEDLDRLLTRLCRLTLRQRIDELGLRPDRADVIIPAVVVFRRLAELAGEGGIRIPRVGVRDGIVFELANR